MDLRHPIYSIHAAQIESIRPQIKTTEQSRGVPRTHGTGTLHFDTCKPRRTADGRRAAGILIANLIKCTASSATSSQRAIKTLLARCY